MNIIEQMLSKYEIESEDALINALKEVYQEIALLGLYRGGFFQKAAYYGGTDCVLFTDLIDFRKIWTFLF